MLPLLNSFGPGHLFFGFGGLFGRIAEFDIHLQRVDAGLALLGLISVLATAAEFFERELQIDDNFAIPVITGFILNLISL